MLRVQAKIQPLNVAQAGANMSDFIKRWRLAQSSAERQQRHESQHQNRCEDAAMPPNASGNHPGRSVASRGLIVTNVLRYARSLLSRRLRDGTQRRGPATRRQLR